MGAAIAAGLHVGFWNSLDDVESKIKIDRTFSPQMSQVQRSVQLSRWDEAVKRSIGFAQNKWSIRVSSVLKMFKSKYQGGSFVSLLNVQENETMQNWGVVGSSFKTFDESAKSYVLMSDDKMKLTLPKNPGTRLGLI